MSTPTAFIVNSYVPFGVTFNAGTGTNIPANQIWIAIFGQLIFNQGAGSVPSAGDTFYLDATILNNKNQPIPQSTSGLAPSGPTNPDAPILPSFTLEDWGQNLSMPVPCYTASPSPGATQFTGRVLISIGAPVQSQVIAGSVSPPSASSPLDPSTGTFCDFLEFTVQSNSDGSNNVDFDTSQVDSFGFPLQLQFFQDAAGAEPFNFTFSGSNTVGSNSITSATALPTTIQPGTLITGNGIPVITFISVISGDRKTVTISNAITTANTSATFTSVAAGPVGVETGRGVVFGNGSTALSFAQFLTTINSTQKTIFQACAPNAATPLRLTSPKDVAESYTTPYTDIFNNYFNSMIDQFFLMYFNGPIGPNTGGGKTFTIQSGASGSIQSYSGSVVLLSSNNNYVLQLQNSTKTETYNIYYPFFSGVVLNGYTPVFPPAAFPGWISKTTESASQMVFGCDGVFADNTAQPGGGTDFNVAVLGDIENSISAAFNRGIAIMDPSQWGIASNWFTVSPTTNPTGIWNYWVQYWHQNGLAVNGMAYAFPYDDKYGASTNMQQSKVGLVQVTLGNWGSQLIPTLSITPPQGQIMQGGPITLIAQISGSAATQPTGTITFYMNGYPFSPTGYPASQYPISPVAISGGTATLSGVNCPPMPDGSNTHTYTLTAVYSGDSNYLPFVASLPIQVIKPVIPQLFLFSVNPPKIVLGKTLSNGATVQLSHAKAVGTITMSTFINGVSTPMAGSTQKIPSLKSPVDVSGYKLPNLTFNGTLTKGSNTISSVSSLLALAPGQTLTGPGIPANTTLVSFVPAYNNIPNTITMSAAASASGENVAINSDGLNYGFILNAVYTPKGGKPEPAITQAISPVAE